MQPGPDFGGEGKEGEGVFKFEGPLGGFVAEDGHAEEAAGPAADGSEESQGKFRDARAGTGGAPFVVAEGQEGDHAPGGEPGEGEGVGGFQRGDF